MTKSGEQFGLASPTPNSKGDSSTILSPLIYAHAHGCTSAWCAQHSSTAAAQNSQLHFSWAMAPTGQSWTELITRFRESVAAWIWVAFNKIEENKQQLDELWKSSNTTFEWKMRFLCFRVLSGSAEALVKWDEKIKYHLNFYSLGNISAKNYQNRLM